MLLYTNVTTPACVGETLIWMNAHLPHPLGIFDAIENYPLQTIPYWDLVDTKGVSAGRPRFLAYHGGSKLMATLQPPWLLPSTLRHSSSLRFSYLLFHITCRNSFGWRDGDTNVLIIANNIGQFQFVLNQTFCSKI